jgi:methylmalonyl-CoA mutase cobalamin-binding subunit
MTQHETKAPIAASAVTADSSTIAVSGVTTKRRAELNAAARAAARGMAGRTISPVLLGGITRLIEFLAILATASRSMPGT